MKTVPQISRLQAKVGALYQGPGVFATPAKSTNRGAIAPSPGNA
jgi:hypothetical protein